MVQGDYRIAKLLIESAANLEAVGDLGNRPLHVAASGGHTQVPAPVHAFHIPSLLAYVVHRCKSIGTSVVVRAGARNLALKQQQEHKNTHACALRSQSS